MILMTMTTTIIKVIKLADFQFFLILKFISQKWVDKKSLNNFACNKISFYRYIKYIINIVLIYIL